MLAFLCLASHPSPFILATVLILDHCFLPFDLKGKGGGD
jgi:hypothetical protein